MDHDGLFGLVLLSVLLGGPPILGVLGWWRSRQEESQPLPQPSRIIVLSLLTYTLAFNVTFFIQELFLVVPKALTPGLRPTLYHNNHNWEGTHALEYLFQGTGALAILTSGLLFAFLAKRGAGRSEGSRLVVLWMAYHGLFQALPQFAIGPIAAGSDTGQFLDWFQMPRQAELAIAVAAMLAIVASAHFMTQRFLEIAPTEGDPRRQASWIARVAVLPAILAIPLLILFRVPREWAEVVVPTIAVPLVGLSWIQAMSWWIEASRGSVLAETRSLVIPAAAVLGLLLVFQLILRPGIPFY